MGGYKHYVSARARGIRNTLSNKLTEAIAAKRSRSRARRGSKTLGKNQIQDALQRMAPSLPIKRLSEGAYGQTYRTPPFRYGGAVARGMRQLHAHLVGRVSMISPLPGRAVTIKVAIQSPKDSPASYLRENLRELAVHRLLFQSRCTKRFVPALYFGGQNKASGAFISAMEMLDGMTLDSYLEKYKTMPPAMFSQLCAAIVGMWTIGVSHGDLHPGNIFVTRKGGIKIIDFGFAAIMPLEVNRRLMTRIRRGELPWLAFFASPARAWFNGIHLKRTCQMNRSDCWTNAEAKALMHIFEKHVVRKREAVARWNTARKKMPCFSGGNPAAKVRSIVRRLGKGLRITTRSRSRSRSK